MLRTLGGRYQLTHEVGGHDVVHVYQAVDTLTGLPALVKAMRFGDEHLEAFLRFQEEGAVISTLKHPNIWQVFSIFTEGDISYMVLEPVEGQSMTEILDAGRLPLGRTRIIGLQLAAALHYAHFRQVVHRDIHPDNVVLLANDQVKLRAVREFGTSRLVRGGVTLDAEGRGVSSPVYMSPEQFERRQVDGRTDIFSVGALLFHVVSGLPPFGGIGNPLRPLRFPQTVPQEWQSFIAKTMARDPSHRIGTARELGERLAALTVPDGSVAHFPLRLSAPSGKFCPQCGREGPRVFCGTCGTEMAEVRDE